MDEQPSTNLTFAQARATARRARANLAKRWLSDFVQQAIQAGEVHGLSRVEWGPHLEKFCWATQMQLEAWLVAYGHGTPAMVERQREAWERTGAQWEDGKPEPWLRYVLVQNEVDNLPPGTLKSTIAMVCANAWIWLWAPKFSWGAASGIDANVTRDSNATRDLVKSEWYRDTFSITWDYGGTVEDAPTDDPEEIAIRADNDAVSDWATTAGGRRYSRTIRRGFTGLHVDGIFIDDPDDADRVWNESDRLRPQNRFTRAIENRVNDEHRSIRKVLQQRVHPEDFTNYLLSMARWSPSGPKGWVHFCMAAEYGRQPEDAPRETPYGPVDWRSELGELMHPRLSAGVLAEKREKLPGYEGQYNQNPGNAANGIFGRRFARFFVFEGENVRTLKRRPDGCTQRDADPPVLLRLADLQNVVLSVDAANSLDPAPGAKVSAVGLWVSGCIGEDEYVLDDRTRVLGVSGTYLGIYELLRAWPIDRVLIELKAMGPTAINEVRLAIRRGWYMDPADETDQQIPLLGPDGQPVRAEVEAYKPGKDSKRQRADAMIPNWQAGRFFFHDGAGYLYSQGDANRKTLDEGTIGEVCSFPGSRRSDRIDSMSQLYAWRRRKPIVVPVGAIVGEVRAAVGGEKPAPSLYSVLGGIRG